MFVNFSSIFSPDHGPLVFGISSRIHLYVNRSFCLSVGFWHFREHFCCLWLWTKEKLYLETLIESPSTVNRSLKAHAPLVFAYRGLKVAIVSCLFFERQSIEVSRSIVRFRRTRMHITEKQNSRIINQQKHLFFQSQPRRHLNGSPRKSETPQSNFNFSDHAKTIRWLLLRVYQLFDSPRSSSTGTLIARLAIATTRLIRFLIDSKTESPLGIPFDSAVISINQNASVLLFSKLSTSHLPFYCHGMISLSVTER